MTRRFSAMAVALTFGLAGGLLAVQNQQQQQEPDVEIEVDDAEVQRDTQQQQQREAQQQQQLRSRENLQETRFRQQEQLIHRASALMDLEVKNPAGEDLGQIEDLTITNDGKVEYAAISFGGFVGIGDKLFAVPWEEIQIQRMDDEWVALVNVTEQTLENAQGFDKDNWPNMADEQWRTQNDRAFRTTRQPDRQPVTPRR